ncbi:cytochrome o ubiquinol oxidase subunit 3 [Pseudochelatococcus lubricantis]|uniref:Cytochrome bo(3) ubiquinol oxidase subunit 3 n=1 Tax=Pseudochelatococcus lubricantis TaxID=1538102 RepID=A0ABX0UYT4_9HYPH|nr:cytochrome o ubiquinol oxidase subunit III [Pseudochelatococcus lubricantis]NIJ57045.1 cytochrome o ubiquinol oxidase subunit 3 [Pseudochelatococcus lubricantis]
MTKHISPSDIQGAPVFFVTEDEGDHGHHETGTMLGFWVYLMSDCLIFASLFAVHAVLGRSYAGGPAPVDLFDLNQVLVSTAALLISSITYGFAVIAMQQGNKAGTLRWLAVTGVFGLAFLGLTIFEFYHLIHIGATPQVSAFLSSFFTLVGTHALHVAFGVIWLGVLLVQISQRGIGEANARRVMCLSMFWHFLDLVWVVVFSFVYLIGVL